jgi:anti-sigma factor (TIGR02949 family)
MTRLAEQRTTHLSSRPSTAVSVSCGDVEECLWEFLDGELASGMTSAVRVHLGGCPNCRVRRDARHALLAAVARCGQAETAPRALRERVAQALREKGLAS